MKVRKHLDLSSRSPITSRLIFLFAAGAFFFTVLLPCYILIKKMYLLPMYQFKLTFFY